MTVEQKKNDSDSADPRWKDLYRIGGIASLLLAGLVAFAVIAYFIWPYTPGFASTEDIFVTLHTDRLGALFSLDVMMLVTMPTEIARRRFPQIGCLSTAAVGLTLCGITGTAPEPPPVVLSSAAFGEKSMNHRILIAYATYAGSTQEVAVKIGKVMGERGFAVDVIPVLDKPTVDDYRFVLVGSAVHGSRWLSEALEFVEANQAALGRVPVALFSLCLAGLAKDEKSLASARDTIFGPLRAFVTPVAEVLFAGRVDRRGVALGLPRWLARFLPTLDLRNWDRIRNWAQTLSIPDTAGQG